MSNGNASIMDSLKRTNYIDFWYLLDEFEQDIERKNKKH